VVTLITSFAFVLWLCVRLSDPSRHPVNRRPEATPPDVSPGPLTRDVRRLVESRARAGGAVGASAAGLPGAGTFIGPPEPLPAAPCVSAAGGTRSAAAV
jgi:hypothetical protein